MKEEEEEREEVNEEYKKKEERRKRAVAQVFTALESDKALYATIYQLALTALHDNSTSVLTLATAPFPCM